MDGVEMDAMAMVIISVPLFIISLALIWKLLSRFPVRCVCHFCSTSSWVEYSQSNCYVCATCDQYNGFTADGDYNRQIPMNESDLSFVTAIKKALGSRNGLCENCNQNQEFKIQILSGFEGSDEEWIELKQSVERNYRLCHDCEEIVADRLRGQNDVLAPQLRRYKTEYIRRRNNARPNVPWHGHVSNELFWLYITVAVIQLGTLLNMIVGWGWPQLADTFHLQTAKCAKSAVNHSLNAINDLLPGVFMDQQLPGLAHLLDSWNILTTARDLGVISGVTLAFGGYLEAQHLKMFNQRMIFHQLKMSPCVLATTWSILPSVCIISQHHVLEVVGLAICGSVICLRIFLRCSRFSLVHAISKSMAWLPPRDTMSSEFIKMQEEERLSVNKSRNEENLSRSSSVDSLLRHSLGQNQLVSDGNTPSPVVGNPTRAPVRFPTMASGPSTPKPTIGLFPSVCGVNGRARFAAQNAASSSSPSGPVYLEPPFNHEFVVNRGGSEDGADDVDLSNLSICDEDEDLSADLDDSPCEPASRPTSGRVSAAESAKSDLPSMFALKTYLPTGNANGIRFKAATPKRTYLRPARLTSWVAGGYWEGSGDNYAVNNHTYKTRGWSKPASQTSGFVSGSGNRQMPVLYSTPCICGMTPTSPYLGHHPLLAGPTATEAAVPQWLAPDISNEVPINGLWNRSRLRIVSARIFEGDN